MLKITTHKDSLSTTFQLEGRLAGPWVEELERCWTSATASQSEKHHFNLDLSGVTYVDAVGKDLLNSIHQEGATLVASGCFMSCLVREITQGGQSRERTKCQDNV